MIRPMVNAQDYRKNFFDYYVSGDMDSWKNKMLELEAVKPKTTAFMTQLINYQYGFIAWCIGNDKKSEADKVLSRARKNLATLEGKPEYKALIYSYQAAFTGFEIGISPFKAPFIGFSSVDFANKAFAVDTAYYQAHLEFANIQFFMPEIFGGSKKLALKHFLEAEKLMLQKPDFVKHDWNYVNLLAIIGQAFQKTGQPAAAREYYLKALSISPAFQFVKNELLPSLPK
jgi:tetratricopeptide (TPR) repeat protein